MIINLLTQNKTPNFSFRSVGKNLNQTLLFLKKLAENIKTHKFSFYTQYRQFYICDKDSQHEYSSEEFWNDEAFNDRLALDDDVIGVGTECYGNVKGELIFLESENKEFNIQLYDHIVEAGLDIKSGVIQFQDCPNTFVELEIQVKPSTYRFRIYSINLNSVNGDDGDDFYRIEVWQDKKLERTVIKRFVR